MCCIFRFCPSKEQSAFVCVWEVGYRESKWPFSQNDSKKMTSALCYVIQAPSRCRYQFKKESASFREFSFNRLRQVSTSQLLSFCGPSTSQIQFTLKAKLSWYWLWPLQEVEYRSTSECVPFLKKKKLSSFTKPTMHFYNKLMIGLGSSRLELHFTCSSR